MDPLKAAAQTAFSGLSAQSMRMRVISENLSNIESTGTKPGEEPYRRKTITFASELDSLSGAEKVKILEVGKDESPFPTEIRPGHPAADSAGKVTMPNVNMIVEMTDMRQATRSYEASLQVIRQSREMASGLIDLLRSS